MAATFSSTLEVTKTACADDVAKLRAKIGQLVVEWAFLFNAFGW